MSLEFGQAVNTTVSKHLKRTIRVVQAIDSVKLKPVLITTAFWVLFFHTSTISALSIIVAPNVLATVTQFSVGCCSKGRGGLEGVIKKTKSFLSEDELLINFFIYCHN